MLFGQFQLAEHLYLPASVQIGAYAVVHPGGKELERFVASYRTVVAAERQEVELQTGAELFPAAVGLHVRHIEIAFGMCDEGEISFAFDRVKCIGHAHGGVEVGCLHQQCVGIVAYRQHIVGLKAFGKEIVSSDI